jgi:hypothetical protein
MGMSATQYRFRIVAGPQSGRCFAVAEDGGLVGRSENCDVIILDPSLSRHHCRFFFRDGLLWVADLKSANSTLVDNVPVQEAPLWKDRRISIGDTVILVESDGSFKFASFSTYPAKLMASPTAACLAAGVVFILASGLFFLRQASLRNKRLAHPSQDIAATSPQQPLLTAEYFRSEIDDNTTRTLHLQIVQPDIATIEVQDVSARRILRQSIRIPRYQLELLERLFTDSGFFSLTSDPLMPEDSDSEIRISAKVQDHQHTVRHPFDGGSASFRNLSERIEEQAANLFGSWVRDFSDDNLLQIANQKYTQALNIASISKRDRHHHLYAAIQELHYASWLVSPILPEPPLNVEIKKLSDLYRETLDAFIRDSFSEADLAARAKDSEKEKFALEQILACLPDQADLRYRTAARRMAMLPKDVPLNH